MKIKTKFNLGQFVFTTKGAGKITGIYTAYTDKVMKIEYEMKHARPIRWQIDKKPVYSFILEDNGIFDNMTDLFKYIKNESIEDEKYNDICKELLLDVSYYCKRNEDSYVKKQKDILLKMLDH